jgi:hypothetical protein
MVVDKSKLPADLWVRMVWSPKDPSDPEERPLALVTDRRRWMTGLIPTAVGILLLIALAIVHAPLALLLLPMVLSLVGARYAAGGPSGYYEVREDGSLGDFLGRKTPPGLSAMRRSRA